MYLIVGLGNPGKEYEHTRHNMGFDVVDRFVDSLGLTFDRSGMNGLYCKAKYFDEDIIVLKPQTFMNLSGRSVGPILKFFNIPLENLIVIFDDLDTPVGKIKLKIKGSSGGHNGIKSIIEAIGTEEFKRIKIGIGRPPFNNTIDYVLHQPGKDEEEAIYTAQKNAVDALKLSLKESFNKAMTIYNV